MYNDTQEMQFLSHTAYLNWVIITNKAYFSYLLCILAVCMEKLGHALGSMARARNKSWLLNLLV